jgi:endonuclease YncB( thermonuclease family)
VEVAVGPSPNYVHAASFLTGHDGDSFWLRVDFGMNTHGVRFELPLYCRLYGIDTYEIPGGSKSVNDPGYTKGLLARDFTEAVLKSAARVVVQTVKPDGKMVGEEKYGRFLCRVWADDQELSDLLRAQGYEKT